MAARRLRHTKVLKLEGGCQVKDIRQTNAGCDRSNIEGIRLNSTSLKLHRDYVDYWNPLDVRQYTYTPLLQIGMSITHSLWQLSRVPFSADVICEEPDRTKSPWRNKRRCGYRLHHTAGHCEWAEGRGVDAMAYRPG